jgi:hypothetical protein
MARRIAKKSMLAARTMKYLIKHTTSGKFAAFSKYYGESWTSFTIYATHFDSREDAENLCATAAEVVVEVKVWQK